MNDNKKMPRLLKSRQLHSRLFGVLLIGLLLVTEPQMGSDSILRLAMRWVGYALVIFGTFGRIYSTAFIGGRKNDEVVRSGPFGMVRNPLYVFSFIAACGIGLQSGMLSFFALLVGTFVIYYPLVVKREEDFLRHKFGAAYDDYVRDVPRWIPNLKAWNEPEQVDSKPKFIRNSLKDAAVFFLPLPMFVLISLLHTHDILPVWLTLP
ncbi:MAG: isoprenylcysteine carboxylmethyltransferase family protein [Alphaproteobacteria bacterium]|nr:isoprenylcysteine carboxylmethyltransferase family protein [Alphaproteobacteria bacterium]